MLTLTNAHGCIRDRNGSSDSMRFVSIWGHSSAGRAPHWQCGGQRFDPAWLHQKKGRKLPQGGFRLLFFLGDSSTRFSSAAKHTFYATAGLGTIGVWINYNVKGPGKMPGPFHDICQCLSLEAFENLVIDNNFVVITNRSHPAGKANSTF